MTSSETRCSRMRRVFSVELSSGPGPSKHFPSTIFSYRVCPFVSVANGTHTGGMFMISVSYRVSILPEKGGSE